MGWIRFNHSSTPSKQLHSLAAKVEIDNVAFDTKECQHINDPTIAHDKSYPFQSQHVHNADLPFIDSSEVAKRKGEDGTRLWIVVDNIVLDVTSYICTHPGGQLIIRGFGGQDCTWQWWRFHSRKVWNEIAVTLRVGRTEGIENRHVKPKNFVGLRGLGYQEDW